MSPDLQRLARAIGECRERFKISEVRGEFVVWSTDADNNIHDHGRYTRSSKALAYIDTRCVEAVVRAIVPAELVGLAREGTSGRWHGGHRCDGAITVGPLGERVAKGADLPAADAMLAAESVNFVRGLSAILGETQP